MINKIDFEKLGKMIALFGMVIFVTYFIIRVYAVSQGLGREFYGIALFMPDRIWQIFFSSAIMVIIGIILYFYSRRKVEKNI